MSKGKTKPPTEEDREIVRKMAQDPPGTMWRTMREKIAFERVWDERYEQGIRKKAAESSGGEVHG